MSLQPYHEKKNQEYDTSDIIDVYASTLTCIG
jgi:hypothetical protein